jgi:hypothetical protein
MSEFGRVISLAKAPVPKFASLLRRPLTRTLESKELQQVVVSSAALNLKPHWSTALAAFLVLIVDEAGHFVKLFLVHRAAKHIADIGFRPVHRAGVLGRCVAHLG